MAYDLSFSPEFFLAEGEPYDRSDLALNTAGKPVSLYSALCLALENEDFRTRASETFDVGPNHLTAEFLLDKAQEVDTCGTLSSPVDVWLDSDGYLTVEVYDDREVH
jgi:hypothetical protein